MEWVFDRYFFIALGKIIGIGFAASAIGYIGFKIPNIGKCIWMALVLLFVAFDLAQCAQVFSFSERYEATHGK